MLQLASAPMDATAIDCARTELLLVLESLTCEIVVTSEAAAAAMAAALLPVHALIRQHSSAGTLTSLVQLNDDEAGLVTCAACTADMDLLLTLIRAGARPSDDEDDVYGALAALCLMNASGQLLPDSAIASYLTQLHDAGLRVPDLNRRCSRGALQFARRGRVACVQAMLRIDPHARESSGSPGTLLHASASACQAAVVTFLLSQGWSSQRSTPLQSTGLTPVGLCLTARARVPLLAVLDTLTALLEGVEDARDLVLNCGLFAAPRTRRRSKDAPLSLCTVERVRVLMYLCGALGAYPIPVCATAKCPSTDGVSELHTLHMEEHLLHSRVYVRDAYRFNADASLAVQVAVAADHILLPNSNSNASPTLRAWAWMRRLHAVQSRVTALKLWNGR